MIKDNLLRGVRTMLAMLVCGVATTSCNLFSDNAISNDSDQFSKDGKTIWVLSDTHVMAPELIQGDIKSLPDNLTQDSKLLIYSAEIFDKVIDEALSAKPDLLLITGDLTKDGELISHKQVVRTLRKLLNAGVKVVVVPGNHDINNPLGCYYNGQETAPAERTSPEQFVELYKDCGYNMAYSRDNASLSYACEPFEGLVLLCIDTNKYDENTFVENGDESDKNMTSGRIREATLKWMLDEADKARAKGKQVVALQHHNIVEHFDGQSVLQKNYILDNHENVGLEMMQHGIHLVFTGHTHVLDIAQYRSKLDADVDSLIDVETGSLLSYTNGWRTINVNDDFTKWDISTKYVKSIPSESDVRKVSYQLFEKSLPAIVNGNVDVLWPAIDSYRSILTDNDLPEEIIPTTKEEFRELFMEGVGDDICKAFLMHYVGNEGKNAKSAELQTKVKETVLELIHNRLIENNLDEESSTLLTTFFSGVYDEGFNPILVSMLTDTNQMQEAGMSSVTDDLETVLYLKR